MSTAPTAQPSADPKRWIALAIIATAQLMIVLDSSIVNIALPTIGDKLSIPKSDLQWVTTAYTMTFGGFLLLGGRLADFLGRKRMFIIGLAGFALSSALGGFAVNEAMLIASRALQGTFAAVMAPAALSIISVTFTEPHERAKAFGVYGGITGAGAAIGLIAGGVLTQYTSWRWCLLVNVPIAIAAMTGAVLVVVATKSQHRTSYDAAGAVFVTIGIALIALGSNLASTHAWGSVQVLLPLLVGAGLVAVFIAWEGKVASSPLLPLRILVDRNRGGSYLAAFLVGTGLFAMFFFLTQYFQYVLGYTPLRAGFAFLPFSVVLILCAGMSSKLLPKFGPRPLMAGGFLSASIGLALLTKITVGSGYLEHVLPSCILIAGGMGLAFVAMSSTALLGVQPNDAGVASATLNASQQIGGTLGVAVLSTFAVNALNSFIGSHPTSSMPELEMVKAEGLVHGYHIAFGVGAALVFAASAISFLLVRAAASDVSHAEEPMVVGA